MISSFSFLYLRSWLGVSEPVECVGDGVEGLQHFRLELGLDRGERHGILQIVLVEIGFRNLVFLAAFFAVAGSGGRLKRRRRRRRRRRRHGLQRLARAAIADRARRTFATSNRRRALFGVRPGIG